MFFKNISGILEEKAGTNSGGNDTRTVKTVEPKSIMAANNGTRNVFTAGPEESIDKKKMNMLNVMYLMDHIMKTCYNGKKGELEHEAMMASCNFSIEEIGTIMKSANVLLSESELSADQKTRKAPPTLKKSKKIAPGMKFLLNARSR